MSAETFSILEMKRKNYLIMSSVYNIMIIIASDNTKRWSILHYIYTYNNIIRGRLLLKEGKFLLKVNHRHKSEFCCHV